VNLLLPTANLPILLPQVATTGETVVLGRDAVEKLALRQVRVSEAFTLQDSAGVYFRASLKALDARSAEALVYERMERSPEPPIRLGLFCAVLARQRMMLAAQKATELGATHLQPLFTERSVDAAGLEHEKVHAWPNQVIRAVKQCRRAVVPELRPVISLAAALDSELWRTSEARLYLDDRAGCEAALDPGPASVALAVGPEGGWTDAERKLLRASGAKGLALGGRVLRAETAVLVALTLAQHRLGDLTASLRVEG
jgi:16S rRNA (uracil1498-N3)-methyltransferase